MLNKVFFVMMSFTSLMVQAQIPAGTDAQHAITILMNTDSVYSQNRTYGWFKFNTQNVNNINGNVINLKAALLPTSSRIIMNDTVIIRIVNLYDSTLNLIVSDTLKKGDTSMVFTANVTKDKWYYIQTIANYPCDTCRYNEAVSFQMKLGGENPEPQCAPYCLQSLGYCSLVLYFYNPTLGYPENCYDSSLICLSNCYIMPTNGCGPQHCFFELSRSGTVNPVNCTIPMGLPPTYCYIFNNFNPAIIPLPFATSSPLCNNPVPTITICPSVNLYLSEDRCIEAGAPTPCSSTVGCSNGTLSDTLKIFYNNVLITSYAFYSYPLPISTSTIFTLLPPNSNTFTIVKTSNHCNFSIDCISKINVVVVPLSASVSIPSSTVCQGQNFCFSYLNPSTIYNYSTYITGPNGFSFSTTNTLVCTGSLTTIGTYTIISLVSYNYANATYATAYGNPIIQNMYCNDTLKIVNTFTVKSCCTNSKAGNITIISGTLVPSSSPGSITMTPGGGPYSGLLAIPPSGTFNNMVFTIEQKLDIAQSVTFNKCDLLFSDNAELNIINPNMTSITINQSYLHSCMIWKGIRHTNNVPLIISNSVIEDAAIAIDMSGLSNANLTIKNSVFNKNNIAIRIFNTTTNIFSVINSIFTSRSINPSLYNFVLTSSLPNPPSFNTLLSPTFLSSRPPGLLNNSFAFSAFSNKRAETGIFISGNSKSNTNTLLVNSTILRPILIGTQRSTTPPGNTPNFENNTSNLFDYLNQGIMVMFGAQAEIINTQFQNIFTTPNAFNPTSRGALFTLMGGTVITGKNPTSTTNAIRFACIFKNNLYGIHFTSPGNAGFGASYNNYFTNNTNGIFIENWNAAANNIQLDITNNLAQNNTYFTNAFNNQQIKLEFSNNKINNGNYGLYINDILSNPNLTYNIHNNRFAYLYSGIYANNTQKLLVSLNNFTLQAAPPTLTPPFPFQSAISIINTHNCDINNNWIQAALPAYSLNSKLMGIYLEASQSNNIYCNIIQQLGTCIGVQFSCLNSLIYSNELGTATFPLARYGIKGINPNPNLNILNEIWGPGSSPNNTYANGNIWGWLSAQYANEAIRDISNMFAKIYYYPNTSSPDYPINTFPPIQKYVANHPNTTVCNLPPPLIPTNTIIPSIPFVLMPPNINIIASRQMYRFIRDNNIPILPNSNQQIIVQHESFYNSPRFYKNDSLVQKAKVTGQHSWIVQAEYDNNNISASDTVELIQKQFNSIYYKYLRNDSLITFGDISQLQTLASLCPYRAGTAVYQARALLKKYDSTDYYNPCEAFYSNNQGSRLVFNDVDNTDYGKEINVKIYPNPLKGKEWYCESNTEGTLLITDIAGRIIQVIAINKGKNTIVSEKMETGIYLVKLEQYGKTIWSSPLIIQN